MLRRYEYSESVLISEELSLFTIRKLIHYDRLIQSFIEFERFCDSILINIIKYIIEIF